MRLPDIPRNPALQKPNDPSRFQPRNNALHVGPVPDNPARAPKDEFSGTMYGPDYGQVTTSPDSAPHVEQYKPRAFPWQLWVWAGVTLVIMGGLAAWILL